MAERPSLRTIILWMRRPIYVAVLFTIIVFVLLFIDDNLNLWKGLVSKNFELGLLLLEIVWGFALVPAFFWAILKWASTTHLMTDTQFIFSRGILNRKKFVVNYEHIQNINVERSFFLIILGLSTVRVETAGVRAGESELEVEGLAAGEAEKLVRGLSNMAEAAKAKAGGKVQVNVSSGTGASNELENLRGEVKRLSAELEEMKDALKYEKGKRS